MKKEKVKEMENEKEKEKKKKEKEQELVEKLYFLHHQLINLRQVKKYLFNKKKYYYYLFIL
jgi:hypothetical protein